MIQQVPPFEQAWIFFSIVIPILLLLKREGAKQAAWLLPLLVIAYGVDNHMTGKVPPVQPDAHLFPSEEVIVKTYLAAPMGSSPEIQREQLEKGWKRYLIEKWSPDLAGDENQRLEDAEYNFTVARLHTLHGQPRSEWLLSYHEKAALLTLSSLFYMEQHLCLDCKPSQFRGFSTSRHSLS